MSDVISTNSQPLPDALLWHALVADDMQRVEGLIEAASGLEFPGLAQILKATLMESQPRWLAASALLASLARPARTVPQARPHLAAGLEVLRGAITVHDRMVAGVGLLSRGGGANVLLGDTAFSRAALLVSQTNLPAAVAIFSQVLADISQRRLRRLIEQDAPLAGRAEDLPALSLLAAPVLFAGACEAGALLAGESQAQCLAYRQVGQALGDLVLAVGSQPAEKRQPAFDALRVRLRHVTESPASQGLLSLSQALFNPAA